jgi:hypothetical protein
MGSQRGSLVNLGDLYWEHYAHEEWPSALYDGPVFGDCTKGQGRNRRGVGDCLFFE